MNKLSILAGLGGIILFALALGLYLIFVFTVAFPAIDRHEANNRAQFQADKAMCESKGGIAKQSSWNGLLTDCVGVKR